jgi:hypothetical protein
MATASSVISVAIVGDSKKFQKAVGGADKSAKGLAGSLKGAAVGIGAALAGLFAINKAFDFLGDSLNEADRAGDALSNLNRLIGKVETKKLDKVADDFHDLGLASTDVLELSVGFARMARAIGLRPGLIGDYADDVAAVAKALSLTDEKGRDAAFFVETIGKFIQGPNKVRQGNILGIKVSEARAIKEALKETGKASADMLTPAELAAARLKIAIQKLQPEVDKALESPDLELRQEQIQARIKELQRDIGEGLSPIIADLLKNLLDISESEWVADMMKGVDVVKDGIGKLQIGLQRVQDSEAFQSLLKGIDVVRETIPQLVTNFQEGWGKVEDALLPFDEAIGGIPEDLQQIVDGAGELATSFGKAVDQMITDLGNFLAPLARIQDIINQIFGSDHTAHFTVVESGTRAGGNVPGRGGDRSTSDAVRREAERNGQSRVGRDNT